MFLRHGEGVTTRRNDGDVAEVTTPSASDLSKHHQAVDVSPLGSPADNTVESVSIGDSIKPDVSSPEMFIVEPLRPRTGCPKAKYSSIVQYVSMPLHMQIILQRPVAAAVIVLTLITFTCSIFVLSTAESGDYPCSEEEQATRATIMEIVFEGTLTLMGAPLVVYLLLVTKSRYLRTIATFATFGWMRCLLFTLRMCLEFYGYCMTANTFWFMAVSAETFMIVILYIITWRNIRVFEMAVLHGSARKRLAHVTKVLLMFIGVTGVLLMAGNRPEQPLCGILAWHVLGCGVLFGIIATHSLHQAVTLTTRALACSLTEESDRDDLRIARRTCTRTRNAFVMSYATMFVRLGLQSLKTGIWPLPVHDFDMMQDMIFQEVPSFFDITFNLLAAFLLSGSCSPAVKSEAIKQKSEVNRQRARQRFIKHHKFSDCPQWQSKAIELAGRGFTLRTLLEFYKGLGNDYMLHFQPGFSTTCDVVRQAIIPLTCKTGDALSISMMKGVPTRPHKMVSHNWGNLFTDLVASIVADALEEDTFALFALMLTESIDVLLEKLEWAKVLDKTYWVCAICVAQHKSICGMVDPFTKDAVLETPYPICNCCRQPYLNGTAPCTEEGASIECEMNKLDDMMHFLAHTDMNFGQVIAVDRQFTAFTRAWVVAEIAAAFEAGLSQHMKLVSVENLRQNEGALRELRVQDMKASRPEDVELILSKIPDKEAFNTRLQHLIFDVIVANWHAQDLRAKLRKAGQCVRSTEMIHTCSSGASSSSNGKAVGVMHMVCM